MQGGLRRNPTVPIVFTATALALTIPCAAQAPTPVSPGDGEASEAIQSRCPTFSWTGAEGAHGYEIALYRVEETPAGDGATEETGPELLERIELPAGSTSWTPSLGRCLERAGKYAWSVRALEGAEPGGRGTWSDASLFEVSGTPSAAEVEAAIETLRRYLDRREGAHTPETERPETAESPARSSSRLERPEPGEQRGQRAERRRPDLAVQPFKALRSDTTSARLAPRAVSTPDSYALSIDGDFRLGGFVFKDGDPFLHNDGGPSYFNTALGLDALVSGTPGTPYPVSGSRNTALGDSALSSNTSGHENTAAGALALSSNTTGFDNTAVGENALTSNTSGYDNTATGAQALKYNTTGHANTATGEDALFASSTGSLNTATGVNSLMSNTSGYENTATGAQALKYNTTGYRNTATGDDALRDNSTGSNNIATGENALFSNTTGSLNTAVGTNGLQASTTGNRNTAVGYFAGKNNNTGSDNVWISSYGADESNTLRIGRGTGTGDFQQDRAFISGIRGATVTGETVLVSSSDQIGVSSSSRRFKEEIEALENVAERLLDLEPVSFRYRPELVAGGGDPEVGLIAEEVAEVFPELVTRDEAGEPFGVRYELLSVLLLDELQRQHELDEAQRRELEALQKRLSALEEGRPPSEDGTPWWRRLFGGGRGSP